MERKYLSIPSFLLQGLVTALDVAMPAVATDPVGSLRAFLVKYIHAIVTESQIIGFPVHHFLAYRAWMWFVTVLHQL